METLSPSAATRPLIGDHLAEDFYRINFQTLLAGRTTHAPVAVLAKAAVRNRQNAQDEFDARLASIFAAPSTQPTPLMSGWPLLKIRELREQHGGLLLALFHFGAHRHVVLDLAAVGVSIVAPVAGRVYEQYTRAGSEIFPDVAERLKLLQVESPRVGRELIHALRQGRTGAIYVDGNMGPDGHHVEEGAVPIRFMGKRIRVKSGIARLARTLKLPVVPVFAVPDGTSASQSHHPLFGRPVMAAVGDGPGADGLDFEKATMTDLYAQLAERVEAQPEAWEFALCFHRWMDDTRDDAGHRRESARSNRPSRRFSELADHEQLRVDSEHVAFLETGDGPAWIDTRRQQAYRCPQWSLDMLSPLVAGTALPVAQLKQRIAEGNTDDACTLLDLLLERGLLLAGNPQSTEALSSLP